MTKRAIKTKSDQNQISTKITSTITKSEDNTITIKVTVPWQDVEAARTKIENEAIKHVEVAGFRKGSVPREIAKSKLSKEKIQEETLKKILTETYMEVIKKEGLNPIVSPQVHVDAFDEGTPLTYSAETCEAPAVNLNKYKDAVSKITAKSKIIVPGKEESKPSMDEVVKAALEEVEVKIPKVIVQQEATRLLSQMLDELKSLGLSLDQYLSSRGKKGEDLKSEYEEKAAQDLKLEFMLRKIADVEKITVDPTDIEQALKGITDPKQKSAVSQNPYLVAAIIRQQKTLDFISKI